MGGNVTGERVDEKRLRDLYDRMLDTRDATDRMRCSSPESLLAVVRRDGPEGERLATLDHVMACGDCARELELLRAIEDAGARTVRAAPWRRYAPFALAASVLLAVGIGVLRRDTQPGNDDVVRGSSGVTLVAPHNDARMGAGSVLFAWRPVAGAVRYELEVLDTTGAVRFAATTPDTSVALTDVNRLPAGVEYRWWVRAIDAAGAQRVSAIRPLRVRRE